MRFVYDRWFYFCVVIGIYKMIGCEMDLYAGSLVFCFYSKELCIIYIVIEILLFAWKNKNQKNQASKNISVEARYWFG